ncbi:MAG: M2 family metallopeptidase [Bacteroidota bacterium]|nr:M2 family metallopeptidase [Bacteroidota bacterium]
MKSFFPFPMLVITACAVLSVHCGKSDKEKTVEEFKQFLTAFESTYPPLFKEANLAYFTATISGKDEDYARSAELEVKRSMYFADKERFSKLKAWRESGAIDDPLLKRQLDVLYFAFLAKQIDPKKLEEMIRLEKQVEKKFSTFRAVIDGKPWTDNEIEETLKKSTNSEELRKVWETSKEVGALVAPDVLRLVKLRNEAARSLGFANYHAMQLALGEQDPAEIEKLFDELDDLTRIAFGALKRDIDTYLSKRLHVPPDQLMPWHYQNRYFQEAPRIYDVDFDKLYGDKDIVGIAKRYYAGIGLPIDDMVAKSDLYEKEGKYQHAYCTDIDREGDVRVVCNIKPSYEWMNTTLHEYGHAVYSKYIDRSLPWVLREESHTFTTEAVAMLFGRFAAHPAWMVEVAGIPVSKVNPIAEESRRMLRLEQLVFSRWAQVMYRFEKAMYENPDRDLNSLWWDLVERYQLLKRPEGRNAPDWASKIHVALYPAYYHNYLLGELLASQLYFHIGKSVLKSTDPLVECFAGRPEVGKYLREAVFGPGRSLHWTEMIEKATGEKLTAKYYAMQFVEEKRVMEPEKP